jgi:hypothetical protein
MPLREAWLHETYPNAIYRWWVTNKVMRCDENGVELTYRPRRPDDVICGARTIRPGIEGFTKRFHFRADQSVPHEVVCNFVGDHGEAPHVGVPAECADMECRCSSYGSYHLVMVGFAIRPERSVVDESA